MSNHPVNYPSTHSMTTRLVLELHVINGQEVSGVVVCLQRKQGRQCIMISFWAKKDTFRLGRAKLTATTVMVAENKEHGSYSFANNMVFSKQRIGETMNFSTPCSILYLDNGKHSISDRRRSGGVI